MVKLPWQILVVVTKTNSQGASSSARVAHQQITGKLNKIVFKAGKNWSFVLDMNQPINAKTLTFELYHFSALSFIDWVHVCLNQLNGLLGLENELLPSYQYTPLLYLLI